MGLDHAAGFRSRRVLAGPGTWASETDEADAGKYHIKRQVRGPFARIQSRTMHQINRRLTGDKLVMSAGLVR